MREILSGVYMWSRFSEPHGYDFNGYLVVQPEGNLCVDPVAPDATTSEDLVRQGVARIVLTNRNHGRAANEIRSLTGAPVAIHPDDAAHARDQAVELDAALSVGDGLAPSRSSTRRASLRARWHSTGRNGACWRSAMP